MSTDGIKKLNRASNCLAGFSALNLPVGELLAKPERDHRATITGFLSFYQGVTLIALRFSSIHYQRSTHAQIAIYMDIFQFTRELMEIESVSMDASGGSFCSGFEVNSALT